MWVKRNSNIFGIAGSLLIIVSYYLEKRVFHSGLFGEICVVILISSLLAEFLIEKRVGKDEKYKKSFSKFNLYNHTNKCRDEK